MSEEKWQLPERFQLNSAERLEAATLAQKELAKRANSPFVNLSPQEAEYVRAKRIESEILKVINQVDSDAQLVLRGRLADALASQGRFSEAFEVEPNEQKKEEYKAYRDASEQGCKCINQGIWNGRPFRTTARYVVKRIWGQPDLIGCSRCGKFSRGPTPQEVAVQEQHQEAARQAVGRKGPAEAAAELFARGHTSALLAK